MKALLLTQYKHLELTDMPVPDFGEHDLLIRVRACGICGSDVHGYDGSTGRRIPPLVMGHEAAGVVDAVGAGVTAFHPGDRVTFDSTISCGECPFCKNDQINLCDRRRVLGVSCGEYRQHGAFAEYVVVPARIAYRLPDEVSFEQAAMVEPVSIAVHAVRRAIPNAPSDGLTAAVVGVGMIGQLIVQVLRAAGVKRIIAIDIVKLQLEMALKHGATNAIDSTQTPDVPARVMELSDGRGADVVLEAVGAAPTVRTAVMCARKGGTVVLVGNVSPQVELPLQAVVSRELTLLGSCASNGEYPQCLQSMSSGAVDVAPILSATSSLEEGPRWFERLYAREPGLMKVILKP